MNRPFLKTGFTNSFRKFFSSFNDLKSLSENRIVFIPSDLISYFKILNVLLILKCIFLSYVMCFVNLKLSATSPITWPSKSWIFCKDLSHGNQRVQFDFLLILLIFTFLSLRKHPFLFRSTKRPQRRRAKEKRMLSQATHFWKFEGVKESFVNLFFAQY